jgi:4-amino-4-deoxy-L-arabinose transferase-like glycosyltransferase
VADSEPTPPLAWRGLLVISGALAVLLLATAGRYGYHRDELYFVLIGGHPDWGYADQPALVPLLAHALHAMSGGSLVVLRLPSALLAGGMAVVTGLMARDFGAPRAGQLLAGACVAVGAVTLGVGHLLSTTTFDIFAWTLLSWLFVRALRDGGPVWIWLGLVAGVALEAKTLVAFFLAGMLACVLLLGPRDALRSWWPWAAVAVAALLWLPNLVWEAAHGWPQLDLAGSIAGGSSGTSASRWELVPLQLFLVSPLLVPVWGIGGWRLARAPELGRYRAFPACYLLLAAVFIVTGGKPYYLAGLYAVLLAAGGGPVAAWAGRVRLGGRRVGWPLIGVALATSLAVAAVLFLPLLPVDRLGGSVAEANYDAGETVGWPRFAQTVDSVVAGLPDAERRRAVVLTRNYGEAGAFSRFGHSGRPVYSGHNALYDLGPPPAGATTVVAVGFRDSDLRRWFGELHAAARVDNGVGLDNDEQGNTVWVCRRPRGPWSAIWPQLRSLG